MDSVVVSLISGIMGVVGALGGVLITQSRDDRRAARERDAQNLRDIRAATSAREREARARLFDYRREVLGRVVAIYHELMTPPYLRDGYITDDEYDVILRSFWATQTDLELYFEPESSVAFRDLYAKMFDLFNVGGPVEPRESIVKDAYEHFLMLGRRDLGVI